MPTTSSQKEEDENFQVLTNQEENVTCTMGPNKKQAIINHVDDDQEAR